MVSDHIIRDVKARHALGIWCCSCCLSGEANYLPYKSCQKRRLEVKAQNERRSKKARESKETDSDADSRSRYPDQWTSNLIPSDPGQVKPRDNSDGHGPPEVASSSTPASMSETPQVPLPRHLPFLSVVLRHEATKMSSHGEIENDDDSTSTLSDTEDDFSDFEAPI